MGGWAVRVGPAALLLVLPTLAAAQQAPLAPPREAGQSVTPVFEGWYQNADGSFSISFGYFNRNTREILDIPIGPANHISPGGPNRGQPTHFHPRRHWGVFAVTVPRDFGSRRVVWTLVIGRDSFAIPGNLKRGWEIDALAGEAGSGNTPPVLRFDSAGTGGSGPLGVMGPPLATTVGAALPLVLWASDDGKASGSVASDGRQGVPVTLTWFLHQGPAGGAVSFGDSVLRAGSGRASTTARFAAPGEYLLRVRANDASGVSGAGHAQCCWSNGFVRVTVRPSPKPAVTPP